MSWLLVGTRLFFARTLDHAVLNLLNTRAVGSPVLGPHFEDPVYVLS